MAEAASRVAIEAHKRGKDISIVTATKIAKRTLKSKKKKINLDRIFGSKPRIKVSRSSKKDLEKQKERFKSMASIQYFNELKNEQVPITTFQNGSKKSRGFNAFHSYINRKIKEKTQIHVAKYPPKKYGTVIGRTVSSKSKKIDNNNTYTANGDYIHEKNYIEKSPKKDRFKVSKPQGFKGSYQGRSTTYIPPYEIEEGKPVYIAPKKAKKPIKRPLGPGASSARFTASSNSSGGRSAGSGGQSYTNSSPSIEDTSEDHSLYGFMFRDDLQEKKNERLKEALTKHYSKINKSFPKKTKSLIDSNKKNKTARIESNVIKKNNDYISSSLVAAAVSKSEDKNRFFIKHEDGDIEFVFNGERGYEPKKKDNRKLFEEKFLEIVSNLTRYDS